MTPRRLDPQGPRRSLGTPLTLAASLTLSACLLGSTALVAQADEITAPVSAGSAVQDAADVQSAAAPATTTGDDAPASVARDTDPAPAPRASTTADTPQAPAPTATTTAETPASAAQAPTAPATEAPATEAPTIEDAPAAETAAATETPVSTPQQQPTPPASAATTDGVTATVRGALDLKPGEKPRVGTPVTWIVTLHNSTPDAVDVLGALLHLEPGESAEVEDDLPPTTLTQADLDAGHVSYRSRYDIVAPVGHSILRVDGDLRLPASTPTPPPSQPATPTTTPTAPAAPATPAVTTDGVTATVRGALDLKPGEKPTVGTPVTWTITLHNDTPDIVKVLKALVRIGPGESAEVEDDLPPTRLTQADLDAGVVTYRSRFDVGADGAQQIVRAHGELTLPKAAPAPAADRVTASVRAVPDLEPGEQVTVGTVVRWIVTFHHSAPDTVRIGGTTLVLTPGRSGYVEDTTQQTTVTQADLDAGIVRYSSEFGIDGEGGSYTIAAIGEMRLRDADGPAVALTPGELPVVTTGGTETTATSGTTAGTETTATTSTTAGTATTAGAPATAAPGSTAAGESVADGTGSLQNAVDASAHARAGVGSNSTPAAADAASGGTSAKSSGTKTASAARLAQTGVDTASALPAAGILGLLGALGVLVGARRRRNRTAD
ncbi:LPXTG cell wall anchor domain-containing protein [Rathayibacter sp. VKM Ac-2835]|uniref:LPXTG cell wall anchor domain-containing protein n=1 Tax=Rathayibacter sp. VKM Ac-2835 TaxID=2739043 RepID=UPI0015647F3A|nr:LPXTG cell wall anchor domain-containing protein [Rathayibacter sp. VKM Ac-2835]NRG41007.1 LPXTG cell wall anchor domain-containing protein [Rathayibacter sp. VKM Ac-2835]